MSSPDQDTFHAPQKLNHITPVTIGIDLVVAAVLFVFWFGICKEHVPSTNPLFINLFGALTSISISGVFWIAIQMFRVVLAGEKRIKAERAAK